MRAASVALLVACSSFASSASLSAQDASAADERERRPVGPGLSAAYRFTSASSFHADVSLGVGWAGEDGLAGGLGLPSSAGSRPLTPILSIGIGYTMLR